MENIKVAFMFGAGAEGTKNFDLPLGGAFQTNTLITNKDKEKEKKALKEYFKNEYHSDSIYDKSSRERILKCSLENYLQSLDKTRLKLISKQEDEYYQAILSKTSYKEIFDHKNYQDNKNLNLECLALWDDIIEYMAGREVKYQEIINNDHFSFFLDKLIVRNDDTLEFSEYIVLSLLLDEKFHTIIDRYRYGIKKFYKVFNYYWHCYFYIVKAVISYYLNEDKEKNLKILEEYINIDKYINNNEIELNYLKILENINEFTKSLYGLNLNNENCYYHYINKKFNEQIVGVITTNYFSFCQKYFGENVAYINGQLKYFEFCDDLEVNDASKDNDVFTKEKLFFPFIFGQSYVKPIIHEYQINEFNHVKEILDAADVLVILGYNINSDDNHINAYLHNFAKDKKIVYITDKTIDLKEKLHLENTDNLEVLSIDYKVGNKEIINLINDKINNKELHPV